MMTTEGASDVLRANGYPQLARQLEDHDRAQHADLAAIRRQVDQILGDRDALALQLELLCDALEAYLQDRFSRDPRQAAADAVEDARELLDGDGQLAVQLQAVA